MRRPAFLAAFAALILVGSADVAVLANASPGVRPSAHPCTPSHPCSTSSPPPSTTTASPTPTTASPTPTTASPTPTTTTPPPPPPTCTSPTPPPITGGPELLVPNQWLGITYMSAPTISLHGADAVNNANQTTHIATGSTSWCVFDLAGSTVGTGTMAASATDITVASGGTWAGGSTVHPGYYTVTTGSGSSGILTGDVTISPANSKLYVPNSAGDSEAGFSGWMSTGPDRDLYKTNLSTATVVSNRQNDPYFTGPQDPARPHQLMIAPDQQASYPTQAPTPAQWASYATALKNAGFGGGNFECPTNEPENGGWSLSAIISYWQQCSSAIVAADPAAHVMGWDSGGIFNNSPLSSVATFLSSVGAQLSVFSNHMENSHQNMANTVALRQYLGALKTQFASSGYPNLGYANTETGINGGVYGVLHPRREARQRTMLRFVGEQYGFCKERQYDFPVYDHHGSGLQSYLVDGNNGEGNGNMRAGAYAVHVMSEALFGTGCSPSSPPAKVSFGTAGGLGDSTFAGLHYTGTSNDVVALATNGLESGSVTLNVSASGTVSYWDGMGQAHSLDVVNGQVTVPVDDLLTYLFLPPGTTVSAAPNWYTGLTDIIQGATVTNETGGAAPQVVNGSFAENVQVESGVPGATAPYVDSTIPATLTVTTSQPATGIAVATAGPAWQDVGCSLVDFTLSVNGTQIYHYTNPTAVTQRIPSASNENSSDPAPYTTFWNAPSSYLIQVPGGIPAGTVTLTVNKTSYGGQADLLGSTSPLNSYHENDPQQVRLAEFQILA